MKNNNWQKWTFREGVDLTTISVFDVAFYDLIRKFSKKHEELFFTVLSNRVFHHTIAVDPDELGRFFYKKFFNNSNSIIKYYNDGKELQKRNTKLVRKWENVLENEITSQNLLAVLKDFNNEFETISYFYIVMPFILIEVWQKDLNTVVSELIKKHRLEKTSDKIINSIYQPWKKTALRELQEKINNRNNLKNLASEYQFLRSWSIIWHSSIDENWLKNLPKEAKSKESLDKFSISELIKLLNPNKHEKYFLEMAPYMIFFKDWRDDLRRKFVYDWSFLWEKIGKYFQIKTDDLGYLSMDEIENVLKINKLNKEKINLRKKNPCIVTIDLKSSKTKIVDSPFESKYINILKEKKSIILTR